MLKMLRRAASSLLILAALLALVSCASGEPTVHNTAAPEITLNPNAVRVTYTIDARAAFAADRGTTSTPDSEPRSSDSAAPGAVKNGGLLINKAALTLAKVSPMSDTFVFIERIYGIKIVCEGGKVVSVNDINNGFSGENSRWIVNVNGSELESDVETHELKNGDSVELIFTLGA